MSSLISLNQKRGFLFVRIGVLVGGHWACFALVDDWQNVNLTSGKRTIAWAETAAIRLGLLVLDKMMKVRGKTFWVDTDNTTTQSTIRKRKSKDDQTNDEWKHIQQILTKLGCNIKERRVKSKENRADELSRGFRGDLHWGKEVLIDIPQDLKLLVSQTQPKEGNVQKSSKSGEN